MAVSKRPISARQAAAMGMLSPAKGLAALAGLLKPVTLGQLIGSVGGAPLAFWDLLFSRTPQRPRVFEAVWPVPVVADLQARTDTLSSARCATHCFKPSHMCICFYYEIVKYRSFPDSLLNFIVCSVKQRAVPAAYHKRQPLYTSCALQVTERGPAMNLPVASRDMLAQPEMTLLNSASNTELEAAILQLVQDVLGVEVAIDQPLAAQGLDSLAAIEIRQKLQVVG